MTTRHLPRAFFAERVKASHGRHSAVVPVTHDITPAIAARMARMELVKKLSRHK